MPVPPDFSVWSVNGDKTHLSSEGKGSLSSDCFPNQKVEKLIPRADNARAAWVKSVQCLLSTAISFLMGNLLKGQRSWFTVKIKGALHFIQG